MSARRPDRRVEKSRRALRDALVSLMIDKGYEETSIADIAERANVGRSTFYAHYADKEDLLQESLQGLRNYLASAASSGDQERARIHPALAFSLPMLEHVLEAKELFRALVGKRSGAPVQEQLHAMLTDLVRERLDESGSPLPGPSRLVAEFIVGSFLSVCVWWMNAGDDTPPAAIDRTFRALAMRGLSGAR